MAITFNRWLFLILAVAVSLPPLVTSQESRPGKKSEAADEPERDLAKITKERRAAGKPDPITVLLHVEKDRLVGSPVNLPELKISLKNVDVEKTTFQIQPTDNYRSGRLPKFRVVVKDEKGNEFPPRERFSSSLGGILRAYQVKPGETWDTTLNLHGYINPLPPGKYQLQVLFSDNEALVELKDISKVVCCQSKTIEFVVEKLVLKTNEADEAIVRAQIAALDGELPLRIVAGTYGKWAHGFIAKDAPAGQLMGIGLPAVPQLVEAAQDKTLKPEKRAWLLAILFSITGRNDPRGDDMLHLGGCLAAYEWIEGPWSIGAGTNDEESPITFALPSTGSVKTEQELDAKKLTEHAAKWPAWIKANCEIEAAVKK